MPVVHHPAIADLEREVPQEDLERWQEAGWLLELKAEPVVPEARGFNKKLRAEVRDMKTEPLPEPGE